MFEKDWTIKCVVRKFRAKNGCSDEFRCTESSHKTIIRWSYVNDAIVWWLFCVINMLTQNLQHLQNSKLYIMYKCHFLKHINRCLVVKCFHHCVDLWWLNNMNVPKMFCDYRGSNEMVIIEEMMDWDCEERFFAGERFSWLKKGLLEVLEKYFTKRKLKTFHHVSCDLRNGKVCAQLRHRVLTFFRLLVKSVILQKRAQSLLFLKSHLTCVHSPGYW